MKTKINISNLKKIGIVIAAGLVLTTSTFASSTPARNEEKVSANMLDAMMTATEQSIRFVAPAVEDETVAPEMESLNALAETIESKIKYVAPAVEETQEVAAALEGLDELAAATEVAVAFKAPATDNSIESVPAETQATNLMLAIRTK